MFTHTCVKMSHANYEINCAMRAVVLLFSMRGSRKFFQRGPIFFLFFLMSGSKYH